MATEPAPQLPWEPTEALGVFVGLLSEIEAASPSSSEFYDRLCEATCRLAHLRRAVIFLWDDARREVRAVGSRDVPLEAFSRTHVSTVNVPIARRALAEDRVLEAHGRLEDHVPAEIVQRLRPRNLICTPMSAGGVWFGVLMAERHDDGPLTKAEKRTLWTLGKVAALAASARIATRQQERARRLSERIELARELHEKVIQRLFGVSMALGGEAELSSEDRARCLAEVHQASEELRMAVQRPLSRAPAPRSRTLAEMLRRLRDEDPDLGLGVRWEPGAQVPERLEAVAQHVLYEAVRNARKHARRSRIEVAVVRDTDTLMLQILNDGASGTRGHSGIGLRLAALEALSHGALLEFGPEHPGRWRVRLMMPLESR